MTSQSSLQIRNPKSEIRNKFEASNLKAPNPKSQFPISKLRILGLFRISEFGFRIFVLGGLAALILNQTFVTSVQAGKVKVWHHDRPEHFDKAQLKQAVVSNEGVVRLSKQLEPLAGLDAAHVWDIVEDKQGNLFVATGNDGKIFQVTPQGKVSIAYESQDAEVLCMAL